MQFKLTSEFQPTGDQPEAHRQLIQGLKADGHHRSYWESPVQEKLLL